MAHEVISVGIFVLNQPQPHFMEQYKVEKAAVIQLFDRIENHFRRNHGSGTDVDVWNLRPINDENEEFRYHGSVSTWDGYELDEISERLRLTTGKPEIRLHFLMACQKW